MLLCLLPTICFALQWALWIYAIQWSILKWEKVCVQFIRPVSALWWDHPMCVCYLQWSFLVNEPFCWAPELLTTWYSHYLSLATFPFYDIAAYIFQISACWKSIYSSLQILFKLIWQYMQRDELDEWGLCHTSRRLLLITEILCLELSFVPVDLSPALYRMVISIDYSKFVMWNVIALRNW